MCVAYFNIQNFKDIIYLYNNENLRELENILFEIFQND